MDNSVSPISPISPESTDPSLIKPSIHRWFLWLVVGLVFLILGITIGVISTKFLNQSITQRQVSSYKDCLAAKGSIIQESYPATCVTASGARFTQPISAPTPESEIPTADPTADWKIYSNTKYGYLLKYEVNPKLKQLTCSLQKAEKGEDIFILDENDSIFPECGFGGYSWPISITPQDSIQGCESTESWQSTKAEIKISEINAVKCVQKFVGQRLYPGPDEIMWVGLQYNSKFLVFNLSNSKYLDVFDQILSTFKFLDQNVQSTSGKYTGKYFSIGPSDTWIFQSDANQSPNTPEVLQTVSFTYDQARLNIQVGTNSASKILASQDGDITGIVKLDGVTATKKSGYGGIAGSVYSVSVVAEHKEKSYLISFYTQVDKSKDRYEDSFNKFISTFKFTD